MIRFWQRLLFPKTASLFDREVEIAHQREINARLVDAVCRGQGNQPAFAPPDLESPPLRLRTGPDAEQDDWRDEAIVREDARLVKDAVESGEGYERLWLMAEEGKAGAQELLDDADEQIAQRQASVATVEGMGAVQ